MAADKVFPSGIYFDRHEKAPDFVIGKISINADKFIGWLEQQERSEKGYVNLQVNRSRDGKIYIELDQWKPSKQAATQSSGQAYRDARNGVGQPEAFDDDLPF